VQEHIEASPLGRTVISGVLIVVLGAMIVSNLPSSNLRSSAMRGARPVLDLTGLHQNWNLFAPNPRRVTLQLEARITFADGTTETWLPPTGDPFVGVYRTFRWRKWASYVVDRSDDSSLWAPTAAWIARIHGRDGMRPVRVQLVRRSYVAPRPGRDGARVPPWREQILFTARYGPDGAPA
jgi:hypothetical protein